MMIYKLIFCAIFAGLTANEVPIDPQVICSEESATLASMRTVRERKAKGLPVYNWGLGESPFPVPRPILEALQLHAEKKQYTSSEGLLELREAIVKRYNTDRYTYSVDSIVVAPGLKQLIFDVQRCFGGEIVHIVPYWVSYIEQSRLLNKKTITIQTSGDYKLTADQIDAVCREHPGKMLMFIFNHPVNPTGSVYSTEELRALADAFRRHDTVVFADEVYLGLCHENQRYSIADHYPEMTIRASSLSKEFSAGGWRLGWALFPDRLHPLKKAMASVGSSSYSCGPIPQQYAAITALEMNEEIRSYSMQCNAILKAIGGQLVEKLRGLGLRCSDPGSAWYTLIDFSPFAKTLNQRGIATSETLTERLIDETGIVFVPGSAFGLPENELKVRASFVDFSGEEALASPHDFFWAEKMVSSIDQLKRWLDDQGVCGNEGGGKSTAL